MKSRALGIFSDTTAMSLHMSIKLGRVHQTRLLLEIGINPNILDTDARTALMHACLIDKQNIAVRIVRMLVDRGAIVSTKDKHHRTALSYACMTGKEKVVQILLEDIEYDINAKDEEGNTPLMYTAMSGNASAVRTLLQVLMKYRLSVDLRNVKGFSAYLLAAKMGYFYCAHILKTEGYASDGIRDSEYFLSDKEWMKKVRKDIAKMQLEEKESRLMSSCLSRSGRDSRLCRPNTSNDLKSTLPTAGLTESQHFRRSRAGTRLTTYSEPSRSLKYNSWFNTTDEHNGRASKTSETSVSETSFLISDNSTDKTEIVPSEARTKTPDLHAILNQYLDQEVYRPVKITPRNNIKVAFTLEGHDSAKPSQSSRQRKQSRLMRQNTRKNVLGIP